MPFSGGAFVIVIFTHFNTSKSQNGIHALRLPFETFASSRRSVWLLRPNDENERKQSSIQVALLNVRTWATSMAQKIYNVC
jgi:hypothetical protein